MDYPKEFRWNKSFYEPIKNIKIDENQNFCLTISLVRPKDDEGNLEEPILIVKRWRRRRDKKTKKLYYRPSRGFNIKSETQFEKIFRGFETGSEIGWQIPYREDERVAFALVRRDPQVAIKLLDEIRKLIKDNKPEEIEFVRRMLEVIRGVDSDLMKILSNLIPKLGKEPPRSLKDLDKMLDDLSLVQVNVFTRYILVRLQALDVFSRLIKNSKTYEYKGRKESMHRFLEGNPWILGDNYEILTSNQELKTLVKKEVGKSRHVKHGKERPDFALICQGDEILVIVEIKKPAHPLTLDDAQQLMRYRALAEKYIGKKYRRFDGFLIGGKISYDLGANIDGFKSIQIKTYTNIISRTKDRYKELLDVYKKKEPKMII